MSISLKISKGLELQMRRQGKPVPLPVSYLSTSFLGAFAIVHIVCRKYVFDQCTINLQ
jgi:hypothetical protein